MFRNLLLSTLILGAAGSPALARDFGNGFFYTGEIELEYYDFGFGDGFESLGYASVDLGYEQPGGGFGAFIGLDSFATESTDSTGYYGALTYSGAFGKIQVGAPRSAYDDYLETPIVGGLRAFDLEAGVSFGSAVTSSNLVFQSETPTGIRYDGSFGAARFGVSYHEIEDITIIDLAGTYTVGSVTLRAGIETVDYGTEKREVYSLGAEGTFGPVKAGVLLTESDIFSDSSAQQLYAIYSPTEALDVTAMVLALDTGLSDGTLYGLSADYAVYQDVYVQAGVLSSEGETAYDISLGVKF